MCLGKLENLLNYSNFALLFDFDDLVDLIKSILFINLLCLANELTLLSKLNNQMDVFKN